MQNSTHFILKKSSRNGLYCKFHSLTVQECLIETMNRRCIHSFLFPLDRKSILHYVLLIDMDFFRQEYWKYYRTMNINKQVTSGIGLDNWHHKDTNIKSLLLNVQTKSTWKLHCNKETNGGTCLINREVISWWSGWSYWDLRHLRVSRCSTSVFFCFCFFLLGDTLV